MHRKKLVQRLHQPSVMDGIFIHHDSDHRNHDSDAGYLKHRTDQHQHQKSCHGQLLLFIQQYIQLF